MEKEPPFTVGDLKRHLSLLDDDCIIHFSSIAGVEPTFYRLKNWAYDENDPNRLTEVVFEFGEL